MGERSARAISGDDSHDVVEVERLGQRVLSACMAGPSQLPGIRAHRGADGAYCVATVAIFGRPFWHGPCTVYCPRRPLLDAEPRVDTESPDNLIHEGPEATLERTRQLLARSRATLDAVSLRLKSREEAFERTIASASESPS